MTTSFVLVLQSLLLLNVSLALGYHLGGNDTNCWKGPKYSALAPSCEFAAQVEFTQAPAADAPLYIDEPFEVVAVLLPELNLERKGGYLVPHANIHMCRADVGWCTPDVSAQKDLVSQSPPIVSDSTVLNVTGLRVSIPGLWSVVAHFTIANEFGEWDVAAGLKRRFIKRKVLIRADDWVVSMIYVLATIGLVSAILTGLLIVKGRNHWVFRASSPNLSIAVTFGCVLAFVSVFMLAPPAIASMTMELTPTLTTMPSFQCNARIWLLSLAFDFVLIPLALKTWRVSVLFSGTFKRVNITDIILTRLALMLLAIDVIFCIIWTAVFPLFVGSIPTVSNPDSVFILQCTGQNQLVFEMVSIVAHGLPLIWLALVGRRVRASFRKRSVNSSTSEGASGSSSESTERKLNQFNESESLSLTLASLSCISIFAIALQYTVTDSPNAQTLMVACGVLWSAFFVLVVLFVPRFLDFVRLEKDGVTNRSSSLVDHPRNAFASLKRHCSGESNSTQQRKSSTVKFLIVSGGESVGASPKAEIVEYKPAMSLVKCETTEVADSKTSIRRTTDSANPLADLALL